MENVISAAPVPKDWLNRFITYALYPLLLLAMLGYAYYEVSGPANQLGHYYGYYLLALVGVMLAVEILHPLKREWRMTRRTFLKRDLPFMIIGGVTIGLANYLAGVAIVELGLLRSTAHAALPLLPSVVLVIVIGDFFWYWIHRWSHESQTVAGQWMWKVHVAHHLPQQVYLFMHGVAHPLNTIVVRLILTVPFFLLGFSAESLFVANLVIGLQGLFSHFNANIRAGWLNYVLMGTELHRYHHSANYDEAKNYGATTPLWDILFGTFYYQPDRVPERLGVRSPEHYPDSIRPLAILALPFRSSSR